MVLSCQLGLNHDTVLLLSWAVFLLPETCVFQGLSCEPSLYIPFSLLRSDLLHGCDFGLCWEILVHLCWFEIRLVTCRPSVFRPVLAVPMPNVPHTSLAVLLHH